LYRQLNQDVLRLCFYRLRKDAASGVDKVTFQDYERELEANLADLVGRLRRKAYRARLVRRKYIPKGNGKLRPLGIPVLEDKLLQMAATQILLAIYEVNFRPCSYGYRPGISAHMAIKALTDELQFGGHHFVVEADIKGFFDHLQWEWLERMLEQRIADGAFLNLIRKWLRAGILEEDGRVIHPQTGTPQGGVISPVLANIYLHYVLDLWFERVIKPEQQGRCRMIRYADDFVACFEYRHEAEAFEKAMKTRLAKFGLEVAPDKTKTLRFGRNGGPHNGRSSGGRLLPAHPPLRTVRESFPSYGSSLSNRGLLVEACGGICQPVFEDSRLRLRTGRQSVSRLITHAPSRAVARLEVTGVVWVVGVCSPADFDMALNGGAGGSVERQDLLRALALGEPDTEEPALARRREVLA